MFILVWTWLVIAFVDPGTSCPFILTRTILLLLSWEFQTARLLKGVENWSWISTMGQLLLKPHGLNIITDRNMWQCQFTHAQRVSAWPVQVPGFGYTHWGLRGSGIIPNVHSMILLICPLKDRKLRGRYVVQHTALWLTLCVFHPSHSVEGIELSLTSSLAGAVCVCVCTLHTLYVIQNCGQGTLWQWMQNDYMQVFLNNYLCPKFNHRNSKENNFYPKEISVE